MVLTFEKKYELLKEYLSFHDKRYPTRKAFVGDFNISNWIKELKKIYFEGERDKEGNISYDDLSLSKEEISMLDEIDFPWGINSNKTFKKNKRLLLEYLKTHNNQYPNTKTYYNGVYISEWVNIIRNAVENGVELPDGSYKHSTKQFVLTRKQYEELLEMCFIFEGATIHKGTCKPQMEPSNEFFNDGFLLLTEYKNKYKTFPTTNSFYKGENLGYFVTKIRKIVKYGEKQENGDFIYLTSKLTKEDISKLDEIEFPYVSESYTDKWFKNYDQLINYLEKHNGEFPVGSVPYKYETLKNWVINQRVIFNNGVEQEDGTLKFQSCTLHKEQIDLLNTIDFPWVGNRTKYNKREITNTQEMINKRRYLLNQLEKLSNKQVFKSKEDQNDFTKKYIKSIYEKAK